MSYLDSAYDKLLKDDDGLEGEHEMQVRQIEDGLWNDGSPRREISFGYAAKPGLKPLRKTFSPKISPEELEKLQTTNPVVFKSQRWGIILGRQMAESCGKAPYKTPKTEENPAMAAIEVGDRVWARIERSKPKEGRDRGFLEIKKFIKAPEVAKANKAAADDEPPF